MRALKVNQSISLHFPDETDRQRKETLRQKVGLTPVAFTWYEFSSINTTWHGWRAYCVVDMIRLSQWRSALRRSISMCLELKSWKPWWLQTTSWALRRRGPPGMSSEVLNKAERGGGVAVFLCLLQVLNEECTSNWVIAIVWKIQQQSRECKFSLLSPVLLKWVCSDGLIFFLCVRV